MEQTGFVTVPYNAHLHPNLGEKLVRHFSSQSILTIFRTSLFVELAHSAAKEGGVECRSILGGGGGEWAFP